MRDTSPPAHEMNEHMDCRRNDQDLALRFVEGTKKRRLGLLIGILCDTLRQQLQCTETELPVVEPAGTSETESDASMILQTQRHRSASLARRCASAP